MAGKVHVAAALLCLFLASAAEAGISRVVVSVDGLACPFCAYGVEKKLKRVPGVASMDVDMDGGRIVLTAEAGRSIDFTLVPGAVSDGGFTVSKMEARATGRVAAEGGMFWLEAGVPVGRLQLRGLKPGDREQLEDLAARGGEAAAEGVLEKRDGDWALDLQTLGEGP